MPHKSQRTFCIMPYSYTQLRNKKILWNFHVCKLKEDGMLLGCGTATGNTFRKDRTGPILCSMWHCFSQSECRQQSVQSNIMADRMELSDIDLHQSQQIIQTMHLKYSNRAVCYCLGLRKGRNCTSEALDQSLSNCHLSAVVCVCKVLW